MNNFYLFLLLLLPNLTFCQTQGVHLSKDQHFFSERAIPRRLDFNVDRLMDYGFTLSYNRYKVEKYRGLRFKYYTLNKSIDNQFSYLTLAYQFGKRKLKQINNKLKNNFQYEIGIYYQNSFKEDDLYDKTISYGFILGPQYNLQYEIIKNFNIDLTCQLATISIERENAKSTAMNDLLTLSNFNMNFLSTISLGVEYTW